LSNIKYFPFRFGFVAIVLIVLLRIAIGWHFFYEGLHKFDPAEGFSAKGFLGVAKGPTAELYYAMLPDLDGLQRLEIGTVQDIKGKEQKTFVVYENAWNEFYHQFLKKHALNETQQQNASNILNRYLTSLREGATNVEKDINAFKESKKRYEETKQTIRNDTAFEQKRRWDTMMKYRSEAGTWLNMLDGMSNSLQSDLAQIVSPQLAGESGKIITKPERGYLKYLPNPCVKSQMRAMDLAVMYGLSAIGICMILGICNRLACLGGAAFLVNVILTTYPVPGVYPPLPTAVGNFMFVSKDAIELLAMLLLASIPAGRWAGLDYFLWHYGGKQLVKKFCPCCNSALDTMNKK
jgi:uncharacterized membrane protein YphA (DoxX/SURF4 family)